MVKILKYDNPDHKIKLKIRQVKVMGKSTGQSNNIGYKWYVGNYSMQSPGSLDRVSVIRLILPCITDTYNIFVCVTYTM